MRGDEPTIGYKSDHVINATLTILHEVEDALPLAVAVAGAAAAVIRRWKHRPNMAVKVIYGPKNEELKRVDVPRDDEPS